MFKMGASENYTWPVAIKLPTDDGKVLEQDFTAIFRRVSQTEIDAYFKQLEDGTISDREIVKSVLVGWKNIISEGGDQIPFSESLRDQMLDGAGVAMQIGAAFLMSLRVGRTKN